MKLVRNQKGSALVWVMVTLAVVLLLATGMAGLSINEARSAARLTRKTQAYYIARAGAEAAADWILGLTGDDLADFNAMDFPLTGSIQPFGEGTYQVEIRKSGSAVTVAAKGSVDDVPVGGSGAKITQMASILLMQPEGGSLVSFPYAAAGLGRVVLDGGDIVGGLYTQSSASQAITLDWGSTCDRIYLPHGFTIPGTPLGIGDSTPLPIRIPHVEYTGIASDMVSSDTYNNSYSPPLMPQFPSTGSLEWRDPINISWSDIIIISASGYYDSITIDSSRTLTIDTTAGDITLYVNQLNMPYGHIRIIGNNKVNLYVDSSTTIAGSINNAGNSGAINPIAKPEQLIFHYRGINGLPVSGDTTIQAVFYLDTPNVLLGGSGKLVGDIITTASSVDISGGAYSNPRVLYAPSAHVVLTGSGAVYGAVVANTLYMSGGARIIAPAGGTTPSIPIETVGGSETSPYEFQYRQ